MPSRDTSLIGLGVGAAVVAVAVFLWSEDTPEPRPDRDSGSGPVRPKAPPPSGPRSPLPAPGYLADTLVSAGWPRPTAVAVEQLNHECWETPTKDWADQYPTVVTLLEGLARFPAVMGFLTRRPEAALLLVWSKHPERVAQVLGGLDDAGYRSVEGLFKQYLAPDEADQLLDAFERHADLLLALADKNLIGCEKLFMFSRTKPRTAEYESWLAGVVERDLVPGHLSEAYRASLLTFLLCQGPVIRGRLADDPEFARLFRSELWPKFVKLAGPDLWDAYAAMPGVWKILMLHDGVELMAKYFQLPVLLLASPEAYPAEFRDDILKALRDEDLLLLMTLETARAEPLFRGLLQRRTAMSGLAFQTILAQLSSDTPPAADADEAAAARAAAAAAVARQKLLETVMSLKPDAIEKEFGGVRDAFLIRQIPGYDVYALADKLADGRPATAADYFAAGMEVISFIPLGTSKENGNSTGPSAEGLATGTVTKYSKDQANRLLARGGKLAQKNAAATAEKYSRKVAKGSASGTAKAAVVGHALTTVQGPLRNLAAHPQGIDLTVVLRLISEQSGAGVLSFQRLARWEIRFVVREGGRVFASMAVTPAGVGKQLLMYVGADAVRRALGGTPDPEQLDRAWRRNAYAWWAAQLVQSN